MEQEEIWDKIADLWDERRNKPLKEAIHFLKGKKGNVLDLCCGSGRNFLKIEGKLYGVDFSAKMLSHAVENAEKLGLDCELKRADASELPFKDNFFDSAIFIAGLHCIEPKEKREKALMEVFRVLKAKARALILVWSKNQERIKGRTGEITVPWSVNGKKYERFTYIYEKEELKELLEKVGFKVIKLEEDENIVAEVEK